jgi:hypothetical protein
MNKEVFKWMSTWLFFIFKEKQDKILKDFDFDIRFCKRWDIFKPSSVFTTELKIVTCLKIYHVSS